MPCQLRLSVHPSAVSTLPMCSEQQVEGDLSASARNRSPTKWRRRCQEQVRSRVKVPRKWQCPDAPLFLPGTSQRLCGSL